jgi:hypothetical protein
MPSCLGVSTKLLSANEFKKLEPLDHDPTVRFITIKRDITIEFGGVKIKHIVLVAAVLTLSAMLLLMPSALAKGGPPAGDKGNKPDGDMGLRGPPTDNGGGAGGADASPPPPDFNNPDGEYCPPFPGDEEAGIEGGPPWRGEGEEE